MKSLVNPARYVPSYCNGHVENSDVKVEVFYTVGPVAGKFYAIGYQGKGAKPIFHYSFKTEERKWEHINKFIANAREVQNYKKEQKQKAKEMAANAVVNVGDLFYYSWGYDQTNIDFYQVVSVKNKTVVLESIAGKSIEGSEGFMCCKVSPVKDKFTGERITKRIQSYSGKPCFSMSYGSLNPTTEDSQHYCSWYA